MAKTIGRHTVRWCNKSIEWRAIAPDEMAARADVSHQTLDDAVWCYELDGITYYGFPFDPVETGMTTRDRALNWLNRHHLIIRREHLTREWPGALQ
ncbi:MAG: hypothetical protein ACYC2K_07545 [Gemmatimonadales bacterium]